MNNKENKRYKVTIVTVSTAVLSEMSLVAEQFKIMYPNILDLNMFYAVRGMTEDVLTNLKRTLACSDFIIVDLMGTPAEIVSVVINGIEKSDAQIVPIGGSARKYMKLGALSAKEMMKSKEDSSKINMKKMQKMSEMGEKMGKMIPVGKPKDMRNLAQIDKYFRNATQIQLKNMIYLILRDYGNFKELPKAKAADELPDISICDPLDRMFYDNYMEYTKRYNHNKEKPTVGILFYGHTYPNDTSKSISIIASKLRKFANVLPIAYTRVSGNDVLSVEKLLVEATGEKVDIILNFMSFRLGAGPMGGDAQSAVDMLKRINVPVLHPFFMSRREVKEWEESKQGINTSEFLLSVMLPELDGCIETYPIGAMESLGTHPIYGFEINQLVTIDERVDKLISRTKSWIKLNKKKNKEKKIAIICYNYPPGESNLFGGAFLDTFESISNILNDFNNKGYLVDNISGEELLNIFTTQKLVNSPKWSDSAKNENMIRYNLDKFSKVAKNRWFFNNQKEQWGDLPGEIMADKNEFLIPGIINKNIFIGLQPSRGVHEQSDKVYHDKSLLPHHQYMAFYEWLKSDFKADAIIHVGTHGTLEFLMGKECGMSGKCIPDMLVSDIPHIYLYYCGNPAEAMIAKRRSHATLVGYQPPVFTESGLYGKYTNLSAMIDEYNESLRISPTRSNSILKQIIELARELNLPEEEELIERELYRMKRSLIPKGLHVYGEPLSKEEGRAYGKFLSRYDRGNIKALRRIIAESRDINFDKVIDLYDIEQLNALDEISDEILESCFVNEECNQVKYLKKESKQDLKNLFSYIDNIIECSKQCNEINGLNKTLNGEFLTSKLAGDIIRNPEVMPSGFNLFQFDPRFIPSKSAFLRGKEVAENTISEYFEMHNKYPKSTGIILWGLETSRTQGETIGQILTYLGVKVVFGGNMWEPKFEIIPLKELKRPRIDVTINICGFFRDMFPNLIDFINEIFETLSKLDESDKDNYYNSHRKHIFNQLIKDGYEIEEAKELSKARIFGPAEGEYGTKLTKIIETKNWEDETIFANQYIKSLKHVYSKNFRGKEAESVLNQNLKAVDIVSQIRSNHEYEVTDLDHYYEYFGGLAKSVEVLKGERVEIFITDTTGEKIETESVEKSINRGIRTRALNPKWIDGMLKHKYHGVQKIYDRFENIMGLSATTNRVEQWIYNDLFSKYAEDLDMKKKLFENNKWAYMDIIEQMLEYNQRGYWKASEEQLTILKNLFLELEGNVEEDSSN